MPLNNNDLKRIKEIVELAISQQIKPTDEIAREVHQEVFGINKSNGMKKDVGFLKRFAWIAIGVFIVLSATSFWLVVTRLS